MNIPPKCINCVHHKKTQGSGDVQRFDFSEDTGELDYCDYTEYYNDIGVPVPYPYFFKQEYPCKGHEEKEGTA